MRIVAAPPRDGDKKQARSQVNVEVRFGRRPNPNTLPCTDCGHLGADRRHEYDHYLGYAAEHHSHVQPVCVFCHKRRDNAKARQTHCIHGHEFDVHNTYIRKNGTRRCRACARVLDARRVPRRVPRARGVSK